MTELSSERIHATCVAIGGVGVLLTGRSGSGKSDLAIRLIDRGAILVSDDSTQIDRRDGALVASAPDTIAGKIELFGVGIIEMPHASVVPVALAVRLDEPAERMPAGTRTRRIAGVDIAEIALAPFEASAPIKVERALAAVLAS